MKIIRSLFVFLQIVSLFGDWDPAFLELQDAPAQSGALQELKMRVAQYLQNSWCTREKSDLLIDLIASTAPQVCVEVGVFTGSTALPILAGLQWTQQGQLYAIDAWSCKESIFGLPSADLNAKWWGGLPMADLKAQFQAMLNSWSLNPYCQILHMTSETAASRIPPIDFLHLDGNFSEQGALRDSQLYVPQVKPGGYILLSNVHVMIAGKPSKMKALTVLLDYCEVICEINNGQALLFRKNRAAPQGRAPNISA